MHSIKRRKAALDGALQAWVPSPDLPPIPCVTLGRSFDPPSSDSGVIKMQSISEGLREDKRAHVCTKFRVSEHGYTVA